MGEQRARAEGEVQREPEEMPAAHATTSVSPRPGWLSDGPLRRLFGNAALLIGGRSMNGVLNLAAMSLIVRAVGLETFGALVLVHSFASAVADVSKFQSWQAVLRYGTPALEAGRLVDFRRLIKLTVLLDLASTAVGIAGAVIAVPFLAERFGWPADALVPIQIYAGSIFFMVTATPTGLLRLFDRFDLLAVSNAIGACVRLVGGIWVFLRGGDLRLLLAIWFVSTAVGGLWLIGHSLRALSQRELLRGPRLGLRNLAAGHERIASFVVTTQLNTTLSAGTRRLGTVVVGLLLDSAAAGLFDIARQVTTLLSRTSQLMKPAIYPELARLSARGDLDGMRSLMGRSMWVMGGIGALLVALFVIFGRLLLELGFGSEVAAAHGLVILLASAAAIRLLSFPLEPALISSGRPGSALVIRAASVVAFLGCLFVSIPRIGLIGAGIATLASALVGLAGQTMAVVLWLRSQASGRARGRVPDDLRGEGPGRGS